VTIPTRLRLPLSLLLLVLLLAACTDDDGDEAAADDAEQEQTDTADDEDDEAGEEGDEATGDSDESVGDSDESVGDSDEAAGAYEVWALDQGTDVIHVFDDSLAEIDTIVFGDEVTMPHMIDWDSQYRYGFVANPASGNTAVIEAATREVVAVLETGPGSHMAGVTPDDSAVWVAVIAGAAFVEIPLDLDADEPVFEIGRTIDAAAALDVEANPYEYPSAGAVCHAYTADSAYAYLTFGPGADQGGLAVVDLEAGEFVQFYDPEVVKANCGLALSADGEHMIANWGGTIPEDPDEDASGEWYVFDTSTHELLHTDGSQGLDAHGVRVLPDGSAFWMVNRASSDGIVIDADTFEVTAYLDWVGDSPDILDFSPDGGLAFVSLRGPEPLSGPHSIAGPTPGFAVIDVATGEVTEVVEPAEGDDASDFHGIGVRPLGD
jgi:DNA-binding beta-propeller fold protein YncE